MASFKNLRTNAIAVLQEISAAMLKRSDLEGTAESRKTLINACMIVTENEVVFINPSNHYRTAE